VSARLVTSEMRLALFVKQASTLLLNQLLAYSVNRERSRQLDLKVAPIARQEKSLALGLQTARNALRASLPTKKQTTLANLARQEQ
jgi:hypothetical protein